MANSETSSLTNQVVSGTKWYVAMRWCLKGMGFVSSAFLARLLLPEDFGLVATVLVVFGFISLLFEFGVNWALIQNNDATDDDFDAAWTIRLMQTSLVSTILALASPYIAGFFEDPRVEQIVLIIALSTFIKGFENIGIVKFQKQMEFNKDFYFTVFPKILSTVITIGLAFYFRSYMALVVGTLVATAIKVIASYLAISFRPKLSLKKAADIWSFSKWVLVRNIASYISHQGDILLLSGISSPTNIGYYRWSIELSMMAITEIQQPFSRAITPALVKLKTDHQRLIAAYIKALSAMTLISTPVALGFGAVAQELIPLFLGGGDKWLPVVPIVNVLVFFCAIMAINAVSSNMLVLTGNVKFTAYIAWFNAALTLLLLYPAYQMYGLVGIAYSKTIIGGSAFFIVSQLVAKRCDFKVSLIYLAIWRPVIAALVMFAVLTQLSDLLTFGSVLILIAKVMIGAVIYTSVVLLLWLLSGKPASIEQDVLDKAKSILKSKLNKAN